MPQGLQVWDGSANVLVDTTTDTSVILGEIVFDHATNTVNVTSPLFNGRTPFATIVFQYNDPSYGIRGYWVRVTPNGGTTEFQLWTEGTTDPAPTNGAPGTREIRVLYGIL